MLNSRLVNTVRLNSAPPGGGVSSPTRAHTADAHLRAEVAVGHATATLLRGTGVAAHATGTAVRGTPTVGHGASVSARATASAYHGTDTLAGAVRALAHATAVLVRRQGTAAHSTSTSLSGPVLGSRSRTQRVGTRTAEAGGLAARQQGSTAHPIAFVLYSPAGVPAAGRVPSVRLSKDGGSTWVDAQGAVAEAGYGWYVLGGHPADRDTIGMLLVHAEAAGCRPADLVYAVTAADPYAAVALPAQERTALADAVLTRAWAGVVGAAARGALHALRFLRNRRTISTAGVLVVYAEDDQAAAWRARAEGGGTRPVRGVTPD